jgi:hypothetical protein
MQVGVMMCVNETFLPNTYTTPQQCCQLAYISAAKHKSGPIKISAARKIRGRIFADLSKNGRKVAELFKSMLFT